VLLSGRRFEGQSPVEVTVGYWVFIRPRIRDPDEMVFIDPS
jgi:hypothetical protein